MDSLATEDDIEHDEESENEGPATSYTRRPEHEQRLAQVLQLSSEELLETLAVRKHIDPRHIAAEVLVTLVRNNYGGSRRVRDATALCLNERLIVVLKHYLRCHPQWYGVMNRSSDAEAEAVSYIQVKLFADQADVCFAEVAFVEFVGMRLLDWLKSQIRLKNSVPSVDALERPDNDDGESLSLVDQVPDDMSLSPEEAVERRQLIEHCRGAIQLLPDKQRTALTLCELQGMTHKQASEVMKLSESSVQKYVKAALTALRTGDWYE